MKRSPGKPTLCVLALLLCVATISCKKENNDDNDNSDNEGHAQLTLTTAGQTITLDGPCTWGSVPGSAGTDAQVAAFHGTDQSRQMRLHLLSADFPAATSSYGFTERNSEDATHVSLSFTDLNTSGLCQWNSFNGSGNITLTVAGDKVNATLNIQLNAAESNPAPYDVQGSLSGSIEFYKPY